MRTHRHRPRRRARRRICCTPILLAGCQGALAFLRSTRPPLLDFATNALAVSSSPGPSNRLRRRELVAITCRLEIVQDVPIRTGSASTSATFTSSTTGYTLGNQIAVSENEEWVITMNADSSQPLAWSNTGYWNPTSAGLYSFIDLDSGELDELRGLMLRPGSSDIHAFTTVDGEDTVVTYEYSEVVPSTDSLVLLGSTSITDNDQDDEVLESAYSVAQVVATYLGCFKDNENGNRVFSFATKISLSGTMTTEICQEHCSGFKYFGTQYAKECWCGDDNYDVFGESTACDDPCDGDASQICGGNNALSISVIEEVSIIALLGEGGGVRRLTVDTAGNFGTTSSFPTLGKNSLEHDVQAVAFSPDGSTLYVSTTDEIVMAVNSDGTEDPTWQSAAPDGELCDIVVSPDGLSVYVLGCATSVVIHLRLDAANGVVASTTTFVADSSISGSTSGEVFVAQALELSVLIGRSDSDEVVVFQRDSSTGELSGGIAVQLNSETSTVFGVIAGFVVSNTTERLFVSMAASEDTGGLVVVDVMCGPTPAPTLAPTP
ncbi:unnamed protein product, partial [Ectocarpus fasciculatus]